MNSLDARRICGCRVEEQVDENGRVLVSVELAFHDASWLTLSCAVDGLSLQAEPQPIRRSAAAEGGHIEIHSRHRLCQVLRPGTTLLQERLLVDAHQRTIGVALATQHDDLYVFTWCGELQFARDLPRELSALLGPQPTPSAVWGVERHVPRR